MSVKAMAWAWAQGVPPATKAVLLALADHADDDGVAWPGRKGLAVKLGIDDRNVTRHIAKLISLGLLSSTPQFRPDKSRTSNLYTLALSDKVITTATIDLSPPLDEIVHTPSAKSSIPLDEIVQTSLTIIEPSVESSEESSPNGEVPEWATTLRGIPKWSQLGEPHLKGLVAWAKKKNWSEEQLERSAIGLAGVQEKTLQGYTNLAAAFQRRLNQGYDDPNKQSPNGRAHGELERRTSTGRSSPTPGESPFAQFSK